MGSKIAVSILAAKGSMAWAREMKSLCHPRVKQGRMSVWTPEDAAPGEDLSEAVSLQLAGSQLVIALVCAQFLADDILMELVEKAAEHCRFEWVLAYPCLWNETIFADLRNHGVELSLKEMTEAKRTRVLTNLVSGFGVEGNVLLHLEEKEDDRDALANGNPRAGEAEGLIIETQTVHHVSFELVWLPAGRFSMGSPISELGRVDDEPKHDVVLTRGFWMGRTQVTRALWHAVMNTKPWQNKDYVKSGTTYPATHINWHDVGLFIERLNGLSPGGFTLPTEAQWEYACRAGNEAAYCFGDDPTLLDSYAWFADNGGHHAEVVGRKKANDWGLFDLHGNVWEWCSDFYGAYDADKLENPTGLASGLERVLRGGSWFYYAGYCRSASRSKCKPGHLDANVGFRLVRMPDVKTVACK